MAYLGNGRIVLVDILNRGTLSLSKYDSLTVEEDARGGRNAVSSPTIFIANFPIVCIFNVKNKRCFYGRNC